MEKQFKLIINIENDAFINNPMYEVSRVLNELSSILMDELEQDSYYYRDLRDINGNVVGSYAIKNSNGNTIIK